jgi:hypothetical protein
MEYLHGKAAATTTTNNGTFWFCGEKPSCELFCSDEKCYMYTRAVAAFRASVSIHPVCPTHLKFAKLCVVKDTMKDNYGRPFFVCSERKNPCKFWPWGDVFEGLRPLCQHGIVCCERKVNKDGPNQNRLFYCCPKEDSCGFFEWKPQEPRVINTGIVLFCNPQQYQYMIDETGETFSSSKSDAKEAYDEFRRFGLTSELDKIDLL